MDGNRIATLLYFLLCLFLSFIEKGLGIQCYRCNSHKLKGCENVTALDEEVQKDYVVKCWQLKGAAERNYTQCRTIFQNVEGEERIIRQCASYVPDKPGCVRRTGTRKIKMQYCHCNTDLCNSSVNSHSSFLPVLLASCIPLTFLTFI